MEIKPMTVVRDVETYSVMSQNENYSERLKEAYDYIKSVGIKDVEDFKTREGLLVGAFSWDEITIFDRLQNPEYMEAIRHGSISMTSKSFQDKINNPTLGDDLASWGKLGNTPKRDELIQKGFIVEGLTPEEHMRHGR